MMTTKTDRTGREWRGNAPAEALDEHCYFEDRDALAAEIRAAMPATRGASSSLARRCGVTPACATTCASAGSTPPPSCGSTRRSRRSG